MQLVRLASRLGALPELRSCHCLSCDSAKLSMGIKRTATSFCQGQNEGCYEKWMRQFLKV